VLKLLSDADANGRVIRGLLRRQPDLDLVRTQDVGLRTAPDPEILEWAALHRRVVLTQDRDTLVGFAYDRVSRGLPMPGVIVMDDSRPIGERIDDILLVVDCYSEDEMRDRVFFVPL
jgi:hypothetical protein